MNLFLLLLLVHASLQAFMSLVTFITFAWDKRQARRGRWRVPEQNLHWLAWSGGWLGSLTGQKIIRHKTQKAAFQYSAIAAAVVHLLIFAILANQYLNTLEN